MKIVNGKDKILGRLATRVAKLALQGEQIVVVNCDKVVIVGRKKEVFERYTQKYNRGTSSTGPFIHRSSDRLVRRAIRGMIPYKTPSGKEAFQNIMCYIGVPESVQGEKMEDFDCDVNDTGNLNYVTMIEISKQLGGKS